MGSLKALRYYLCNKLTQVKQYKLDLTRNGYNLDFALFLTHRELGKYRSILVISIFFPCCILGNHKGSKLSTAAVNEPQNAPLPIEVPELSLDELKEKTDNFGSKSLIGEGSYGRVYYATLNDGKAMAIKKLDVSSEPEPHAEFLTQVCVEIFQNPSCLLHSHQTCDIGWK